MGVRLYPRTQNTAILERLADVPAGTYNNLAAFESDYPCDNTYERYQALQTEPNRGILQNFILFGWGKLSWGDIEVDDYDVGRSEDLDFVKAILAENGIVLPDGISFESLDGVAWN